jgi:hypothetical protein
MFALKYLKSSLQMPALFGGKPVSDRTNKCLKVLNVVMIVLSIVIPLLSTITSGLAWLEYLDFSSTAYRAMYLSFSLVPAF